MNPIAVTSQPLDMDTIVGLVSTSGGFGAIASFVGVVRNNNQNRIVTHLEYEAYEPLAVKALEQIRHEQRRSGRACSWRSTIGLAGWTSARPAS